MKKIVVHEKVTDGGIRPSRRWGEECLSGGFFLQFGECFSECPFEHLLGLLQFQEEGADDEGDGGRGHGGRDADGDADAADVGEELRLFRLRLHGFFCHGG